MKKKKKVAIQGYEGSFHDESGHRYFGHDLTVIPSNSFNEMAIKLKTDPEIDYAVMAIENSIAGTILQNYRILRENSFTVIGEIYLKIDLNLMALADQSISDIQEIHSHPMAIRQCFRHLNQYENIKLVESEDTALSAAYISENKLKGIAAIASERAAQLYNLQIIDKSIQDSKFNYTRFFIIQNQKTHSLDGNKSSIWCRVKHEKGSLLTVLEQIKKHNINLSKLQSFPVLGEFSEYFFHMDLEFESINQYFNLKDILEFVCIEFEELGIYKRADISAAIRKEDISVLL